MKRQSELLADRFSAMQSRGLVDVKFLLVDRDKATLERVCREANELWGAYEKGECAPLDFKDSRRSSV